MNTKDIRVSFIGGGNMASALITGLVAQGFAAAHILVVEPEAEKRNLLTKKFKVEVTDQLPRAANSDVIILAVKPQQMRDLAIFLSSLLNQQLVISIAAGIRLQDLSRWLGGYQKLVRAMPNTPAQIQAGITAIYATPQVSAAQRDYADHLLKAAGQVVWLDNEAKMDAITAVSGSGPAYVFYFLEAMQEAALALGLNKEEARALSLETFSGASRLATESSEAPAELRAKVTSKGGTTEAAIQHMQTAQVKQQIINAIKSAAARAGVLGQELGKD
jgi:pyrroline-5-carboxylate reductase